MVDEGDDDLVGEVLGGRYRVERLIESGGMGAVYEAVQEPLGRRVALKVLHSHLVSDDVSMERFRREAEATARLHHPHIVQVTDYRAAPGEPPFLVMELVEGRPLATVMREDGIFPPERAAHVAVQVLDALGAAHEAGIVHRDLKPTNVVLGASEGLRDVVTILDFGIAKLLESADRARRLTVEGALVGTPAYMAPEQARGQAVDGRADLYALGVLMFGMLAGRLPYPSKDPGEILRAIVNDTPPPLIELRPDLDPDLAEVVDRALAKEPSQRWQSAREMRRALQRWLRRVDALRDSVPVPAASEAEAESKSDRQPAVTARVFVLGLMGAAALGAALMYLWRPAPERVVVRETVPAPPTGAEGPEGLAATPDPEPEPAREPVDAGAPSEPSVVQRAPTRRIEPDTAPRLRVQGAAGGLYPEDALSARLAALTDELRGCLEDHDIPEGAAPPVWHLDVTPEGHVRSVQTSLGEWPLGAANCVTRAMADLDLGLGPTATGDGGRVVLTFGPG